MNMPGAQPNGLHPIENVHFNPHAWGRCTFNTKAREGEKG